MHLAGYLRVQISLQRDFFLQGTFDAAPLLLMPEQLPRSVKV